MEALRLANLSGYLEAVSNLRRSLNEPIPAIFEAAERLLEAVEFHGIGDRAAAEIRLREANCPKVWAYTDECWGRGASVRYGFVEIDGAPAYLAPAERPKPRMPDASTKRAVVARDGLHCRFCGVPVVDPAIRKLLCRIYPAAVGWGTTNASQHAALQCLWLQYDHLLPNSRGGDSSFGNVVVTCAPCNFGRMETTLAEARLMNPLERPPPISWARHAEWDGLLGFRSRETARL